MLISAPAVAADLAGLDWTQAPGRQMPVDAPLQDADGRPTSLATVAAGHPLLLAPGYYKCPNLCGILRDDLFAALAASHLAPRDYRVALVTIDPAETPADAQAAAAGVHDRYPGAQFAALTGPAASLDAIAAAAGFHARFDAASKQFLHPAGIVVLTPSGAVSTYLLGLGYAADDLERAVADAAAGAFRPAEPVHLFCFSYDATTGRLTATVMDAVRLGAIATVLGIAAFLLRLGRRA